RHHKDFSEEYPQQCDVADFKITNRWMRIPMMSISHSDLMPISSERSDAGLSQCEIVIDISQEVLFFFVFARVQFLPFG
ncbi:MAG TPA: hypothetical protein VFL79_09060, partial [Terriglobia bacterium]|nr:hypothetical protein [Terriglobia bacterium]